MNEFVAYLGLAELGSQLSDRTMIIASYALCGFANISSIGIQIGGIGVIAGKNKADFNSFKEAVYLALDVFNSRNQYKEISANPMKIREKQEEKNNR